MISKTTMVNINVPVQTLRGFDHLCRLAGKTRTSVLIDMMRSFVINEGKTINEQAKTISSIAKAALNRARKAAERRSAIESTDRPDRRSNTGKKRFSEFLNG